MGLILERMKNAEELQLAIDCMTELLVYYRTGKGCRLLESDEDGTRCPLCRNFPCRRCPWVVMTGNSCARHPGTGGYPPEFCRRRRLEPWTSARIIELSEWIELYKIRLAELKGE